MLSLQTTLRPLLVLKLLLLSTTSRTMECLCDLLRSTVPAVSSPNPLPTSSQPLGEGEKDLRLCKQCSATAKTLVGYVQSTASYRLLWSKNKYLFIILLILYFIELSINMANTEVRLYHFVVSQCSWNAFMKIGITFATFWSSGIKVVLRKWLCTAVVSWGVSSLSSFWT